MESGHEDAVGILALYGLDPSKEGSTPLTALQRGIQQARAQRQPVVPKVDQDHAPAPPPDLGLVRAYMKSVGSSRQP